MVGLVILILTLVIFSFFFWYSGRKYNQDIAVSRLDYHIEFPKRWGNDRYGHHSN